MGGGREVQLHSYLTSARNWVVNLTSRSLYPDERTPYSLNRRLGGPQGRSGRFGERKTRWFLWGFEPSIVHLVAHWIELFLERRSYEMPQRTKPAHLFGALTHLISPAHPTELILNSPRNVTATRRSIRNTHQKGHSCVCQLSPWLPHDDEKRVVTFMCWQGTARYMIVIFRTRPELEH